MTYILPYQAYRLMKKTKIHQTKVAFKKCFGESFNGLFNYHSMNLDALERYLIQLQDSVSKKYVSDENLVEPIFLFNILKEGVIIKGDDL